jgi:hypothetical protein
MIFYTVLSFYLINDITFSGREPNIAGLESDMDRHTKARSMYELALAGKEKALGPDHISTLDTSAFFIVIKTS